MQDDPVAYWNELAGPRWVASQQMLDSVMAPVTESLIDAAALRPGERVVDIGCGAGSLSFAALERVGANGRVVGVDISEPLVDHAIARAQAMGYAVGFTLGDAQTFDFTEPADVALSRFGVMFFRDSVAAFANIAKGLASGGRCVFAVWQTIANNPWITWPIAAIADLLPSGSGDIGDEDLPGPFRFADEGRLIRCLAEAGYVDIAVTGVDRELAYRADPPAILELVQQVGPLSRALGALEPDAARRALGRVEQRIVELHDGDGLQFPGAWWIVRAQVGR